MHADRDGIAARKLAIDIHGASASVEKEMAASPARMIGKLTVRIDVPQRLSDEQKRSLELAANTCPVHKSLHPDVQMPIEFTWGK